MALLATAAYAFTDERRVYLDSLDVTADTILTICAPDQSMRPVAVEACIGFRPTGRSTGRHSAKAALLWGMTDSGEYYMAVIYPGAITLDDAVDDRYLQLEVVRHTASGDSLLRSVECRSGINPAPGQNHLAVELDPTGKATVSIGRSTLTQVADIECAGASEGRFAVMATAGVRLPLVVAAYRSAAPSLQSGIDEEAIRRAERSPGSPVGIWEYLDRDTDSRRAMAGGRYRLGIIPAADGGKGDYDIVYLGGAEVNSHLWKTGMIKGRLKALPFASHWDLQWYDSDMRLIVHDINASMEQNSILSLNFPLMKSTIRFYRAD